MISWTPSLEVGVPIVDAQHRELFDRAARFEEASRAGFTGSRLGEVFEFLTEYARVHFESEERLMAAVGYPERTDHVREHREFTRRLSMLVPLWDAEGDSTVVVQILRDFIATWLVDHVSSSDQRLGAYVRGLPART